MCAKKGPGGRARSQNKNENQLTTKTTNHTKKEANRIQVPDTDSSFVLFGSVVVKIGLLSHLEKVHATAVPFSTKVNDGFELVFPPVSGDTSKVSPPFSGDAFKTPRRSERTLKWILSIGAEWGHHCQPSVVRASMGYLLKKAYRKSQRA
jgi:hypothetical protein